MNSFRNAIFSLMFLTMLSVTVWASLDRGIWEAGAELMGHPWFVATLTDAYLAFVAFYVGVVWPTLKHPWARVAWFLSIMTLGSMAIAAFAIWYGGRAMTVKHP